MEYARIRDVDKRVLGTRAPGNGPCCEYSYVRVDPAPAAGSENNPKTPPSSE